jgi:hypothetical protein
MSKTKIYPDAQAVIDRLRAHDWRNPRLDKHAVEAALNAHLTTLGLPARPIRWFHNPKLGYGHMIATAKTAWEAAREAAGEAIRKIAWESARKAARSAAREEAMKAAWEVVSMAARTAAMETVWEAAWSAAWSAAREAAWSTAEDVVRKAAEINVYNAFPHKTTKRLVDMAKPLRQAFENGLFLYWITPDTIVCTPQPALHSMNNVLHCESGPAVQWIDESYWFWRGRQVPQWVIEEKHKLNPRAIVTERNAELRRVMLEIYGFGRWISETGATLISEDVNHGQPRKLYEATLAGGRIRILHVVNGSLENDGSRREFFLGAPDDVKTPHEAVAASYGFDPEAYSEYART